MTRVSHRPALALLAVSAIFATVLTSLPCLAQPAKKDSSARTRPKDATLTASITPIEARPGGTVTYKVTAKLNPGWHIYTYAKEQQGEGPRNTRFDFFETAGLAPVGEWAASKDAITRKEPAFPDLESVSFYEDEVTWSFPLKVPANTEPGKKSLGCQASYQICSAKSCSFPGQWTLPEVVLTVLPADQAKAAAEPSAKPKRGDSPARILPKEVTLSASISPAQAKPGETVTLKVTAKLDPGFHIYDYAREQPDTGPRTTGFDLFDSAGLKVIGDWKADTKPIIKAEPAFDDMLVASFEDQASWSLKLTIPADAAPGNKSIRLQAAYQVCDAKKCSPPVRSTLPEVMLTVLAGGAKAEAAPSPPEAPGQDAKAEAAAPAAVDIGEKPVKALNEAEKTASRGVIPLMIASALGGLLALVMPCVWPMVPITVNFFVKQGQKNQGSTTGLAITYCLAIIGVFTAVGVLCSFFVSATALPKLANNPWLNFAVAGLFFAFGLSLLGLFEIRLPNALLNASAKGEGRGGLVGVFFMAMTLTITSFTCTFPVVGGLLVMASTGQFFYPIIGLATFATVLALPFFLLALAPGLLSSVPKSGDWMNSVKVVGGLIEIGAAFKFLNTAELSFVTPDNAWIDAQVILTAWVILAAVCGFYLLGFFRTDHDLEEVKVGPGRMILGCAFLGMGLFLAPALFGTPPRSQVWDRLVIGLLPPDAAELSHAKVQLAGGSGGNATSQSDVHATDTDPKKAERQEKRFHGVLWGFSYEEALERAKAENKPVLIDFTGLNCANCRLMESRVLPKPEVVDVLKRLIPIQLYTPPNVPIGSITPDQREALAEANALRQIELANEPTNPLYVVVSPEGKVLATVGGYNDPDVFIAFLNKALAKHESVNDGKVAQADLGR